VCKHPASVHLFLDHRGVHVGNLSDGELRGDLGGDDGLRAGVGEGPLDAVDGDGGVAPHVGQQVHLRETASVTQRVSASPLTPIISAVSETTV